MSEALAQAFASATETPVLTVIIRSPGVSGGAIAFAQSYKNITATLEDGVTNVLFEASGAGINWPKSGLEGVEDISIRLENVSMRARAEMRAAKKYHRANGGNPVVELRAYLPSDYSAPVGQIYKNQLTDSQVDRVSADIKASFNMYWEKSFPWRRYYGESYAGLRLV